jgi:hypothetical protein
MDHHDLPGAAGPHPAAILERLGAPQSQADGIGLVAVQVEGMAAEARGEPLQAAAVWSNWMRSREAMHKRQDGWSILPDMEPMIYDQRTKTNGLSTPVTAIRFGSDASAS